MLTFTIRDFRSIICSTRCVYIAVNINSSMSKITVLEKEVTVQGQKEIGVPADIYYLRFPVYYLGQHSHYICEIPKK